MTKLVVDPAIRDKLKDWNEPVELCDESGQTLGYFHPAIPASGKGVSPFGDEEIEKRRQQRSGRPLSDILKDLKQA